MPRPLNPKHQHRIDEIVEALDSEKRARERARLAVQEMITDARKNTDRLIFQAVDAGVPKTAIQAATGLSYTTVYGRELNHKERVGYAAPTKGEPASIPTTDAITVEHDTEHDTYTVKLKGFTHPDVGEDVTGWAIYDGEGDVKTIDLPGATEDPFLPDRLWATTEVQSRVHA